MIVDFHVHTCYSTDSLNSIPALLNAARKRGLDRIVITDHNTIQGALEACAVDAELVIIGEEIKTTKGELLAAFVSEEVPAGLPPLETITLLRSQGAFISVSHPFDHFRSGWELTDLEEITPLVDAIEIFNARVLSPRMNLQAQQYASAHHLAGTAGSDGHALFEVGRAALDLPAFDNAESLRQAVKRGSIVGTVSPAWVHLTSTWAKLIKH